MDSTTIQFQKKSNITIDDVAQALGVSKTTVSRAISGKGRIGEKTRERVLAYIKENNYQPNVMAKGLAQSKTYNIAWVIPGDTEMTDMHFFQRCMMGVSEVATANDYDILISTVYDNDISQLKRAVKNHKVDGLILGRTLIQDERVNYLKQSDMPFVVIGSCLDEEVIQIDNDHVNACKELTSILIMKGLRKVVLIGGDSNHVVNCTRRKGYELALAEQGLDVDTCPIYMDLDSREIIERVVDEVRGNGAECIICMDDRICYTVLNKLNREGVDIPTQIKVASFYNSTLLESNKPPITTLQYDPKELGIVACKTLFDYIDGVEVKKKQYLGYEVNLKGSTQ